MDATQAALIDFGEPNTPVAIARVLVDVDLPHLDHPLDYSIPESMLNDAQAGRLVRVRLAGRKHLGWIVERAHSTTHSGALSPLLSVASDMAVVTPSLLALARYVADRNVATASQALSLAVPARHAATEKAIRGQLSSLSDEGGAAELPGGAKSAGSVPGEDGLEAAIEAWASHPGGRALIERLQQGQSPRGVWTALPPSRYEQLVGTIRAALASGRTVLLVAPTSAQVEEVAGVVRAHLEHVRMGAVTSEDSAADRYRVHLEAMNGLLDVVVGARSAVWTPLSDLGLIIVWDDGDDRLVEQRAPRVSALDVAVARAHLEGVALLAGAFSRSVKAQALVRSGWAASLDSERSIRRESTARVNVPDEVDRDREGPSAGAHLPLRAQQLVRQELDKGPVLIHVPNSGYVPVVSCQRCRQVARCVHCGGPLAVGHDQSITCGWCARGVGDWRCSHCAGTHLRAVRVGSDRTGEELGRAFPGVALTVSSSSRGVVREVGPEPRLVVATPGAEPRAPGGYAAALILDADAIAGRPELWAPEEALRRWFNALALVRPRGPGVVLGGVEQVLAQTLIRWDPVDFADRAFDERAALGFFPASTIVALDGPAPDVEEIAGGTRGQLMGVVPHGAERGHASTHEPEYRALLRTSRHDAPALFADLKHAQQQRASRRRPLVRITVNPPELF